MGQGAKKLTPLYWGEKTAYRGATRRKSDFSDCRRQSHHNLLWQRPGSEEHNHFIRQSADSQSGCFLLQFLFKTFQKSLDKTLVPGYNKEADFGGAEII